MPKHRTPGLKSMPKHGTLALKSMPKHGTPALKSIPKHGNPSLKSMPKHTETLSYNYHQQIINGTAYWIPREIGLLNQFSSSPVFSVDL